MKKVDELNLREKYLQTKISYMKMKGIFLGLGLVFSWVCVCLLVFLSVSGLITISVCDTLVDLKKLADQMSLLSWQNKLNRCFMFKIHVMKGG